MDNPIPSGLKKKKIVWITVVFFIVLTGWWLTIYFRGLQEGIENNLFTVIYPWVSLWGGIAGLVMAKRWGGYKSIMGRAIGAFSFGLLGQAFGQVAYSYYIFILGVEVPYPSIGDIGYFSTGLFYAYGSSQLMRAAGVKFSLRSYSGKAVAVIIPLLWAFSSYYFFLKGYVVDWHQPVTVILDLVSPVIDGIYLSLAILTYIMSRKLLGGLLKIPVLLLLISLAAEAISDYVFLFRESRGLWYVGGVSDYMYLVTYTIMALTLMILGLVLKNINEQQ